MSQNSGMSKTQIPFANNASPTDMNHWPIFVVNLKSAVQRRDFMSAQLDKTGLDYEFVEAVDGRQIGADEIVRRYGLQTFRKIKINKQIMTLGAVGCLLSHLKLYKKMIDENVEVACILEDDAVLKTLFAKIITSRQVRQGPWDVLLLGHYSMHKKCFTRGAEALYWRRWTYKNHCIAQPAVFPFTTLAYLIKKE